MTKKRFSVVKTGKKVLHDIYFNARKRNKIKRDSLILQKGVLENADATIKPVLKREYREREIYSNWAYVSTIFLRTIKNAENLKYRTTLKNCSFKLYKSKKKKTVIIENKFFKVWERKNKTALIVFPNGLPDEAPRSKLRGIRAEFLRSQPHFAKASLGVPLAPSSPEQALRYSAKRNKSKRKCKIHRKGYKLNTNDYLLIDFGKFRQRIVDFSEFSIAFKGNIFNKKILFKQIKKSNKSHWSTLPPERGVTAT
ncbi:MAG: hypothetical protein Q7S38_02025 [bacterium]|nr:hypothetical protein [bacterium]